jgi:N6-adenosine-specific RNA methylase IME4
MSDPRDLVLLTKAQRALAEASTIDDVRDLRDQAAAVKTYVQKARLGKHLVIEAAALRIRAERRLGQMLQEIPLANSVPGNQRTDSSGEPAAFGVLLNDLGITKNESSRSQRIADVPDAMFEQYLADCERTEREPTFARLLRLARADAAPSGKHPIEGQTLAVRETDPHFESAGAVGRTLLAIPPWRGCTSADQSPLAIEELCQLPIGALCEADSHLYVWTNRRYLIDGFDLMDAWGFAYCTCLSAAYEEARADTPWGDAHHLLLVGKRGDLPFRESSARSWLLCNRPEKGQVPDEIRNLIEAASPGPHLQVFGTRPPRNENWTVCPIPTRQ